LRGASAPGWEKRPASGAAKRDAPSIGYRSVVRCEPVAVDLARLAQLHAPGIGFARVALGAVDAGRHAGQRLEPGRRDGPATQAAEARGCFDCSFHGFLTSLSKGCLVQTSHRAQRPASFYLTFLNHPVSYGVCLQQPGTFEEIRATGKSLTRKTKPPQPSAVYHKSLSIQHLRKILDLPGF